MDQEIREILREAKSKGATTEQLQRIADAYFEAKKKNQSASGLKEPGAKTASTASQSQSGGGELSTRPTLAAAAGKPEVQTPSESVRSGLKPTAGRQLETGEGIRGLTDAEKFKRAQEKAAERGLLLVTKEEAEKRKVESFANTGEFIALRPATMLAGAATAIADLYDTSVSAITGGNIRPKTSEEIGKLAYALGQEEAELNKRILGEDVASKGISELVGEGNVSGAAQKAALGTIGIALDMYISRKISNPFAKAYKPTMSIPQTLSFSRSQFLADATKRAFRENLALAPLALKAAGYKIEEIQREQAQADVFDDFKTLGVGSVIGGIEYASEAMFRTSVDDLLLNGFSKNFVSNLYKSNKPVREAVLGTTKELLTQSGQEGVEELVVELADIVIDGTLYGKDMLTEANAFSLIDSFILGSLVAGPTTLLSYGPSSVGKASSINARRKVIDDLNSSYDKLSDESLSPLEKMEIKKGIEAKLDILAEIQKKDNDFYELFSEEDKMAALVANQKITMAQVELSKIEDPDARFNIEQGLKKAYSEKTKVESKYDPNIKVYEYVGQEGKPVPSAEQTGETSVQAQPVQEAGTKTPETDRIFQALEQDETLGAMERGEEVYEDDAVAAQERILGLIDQVNSLNLPQEVKDQYIEVLGEKFEDLEYYDNKTTVSIEESTERRPVGAPKRVIRQKVGERASTGFPRLRNYERLNNSQVTTGKEAEGEVSVIEEQEDGTVALVSYKDGVKAESRPIANSLLDLEYVESVFDNDGTLTGVVMRPKTAKGQPESTETFTISNKPELAMDIAIQAKTEQVGSVAQADFEYAFEEVTTKKVVKKKMPVQERPVKPAKAEPVVQKKEVNAPTKKDLNRLIESDPARAEVYAAMLTSMDLLNGYYPNARFVLTENDAETNEYLTENDPNYDGGNVYGQFFQNKNTGEIEILINKQRARTSEVVFHEVFHAGFAKVYGQSVEKAKEFTQALSKVLNSGNAKEKDIAKQVDEFIASRKYEEDESSEEYLAESAGILSANKANLSAGMVNKLKNFFNNIAKKLKMKQPLFKEAATTVEVVDFLNGFIKGVNSMKAAKTALEEAAEEGSYTPDEPATMPDFSEVSSRSSKTKFLDDAPKFVKDNIVDLKKIAGRKIPFAVFYDNTRVGKSTMKNTVTGKESNRNLMGGFGYSQIDGIKFEDEGPRTSVLAFTNEETAAKKLNEFLVKEGDLVPVVMQNPETGHLGNLDIVYDFFDSKEGVVTTAPALYAAKVTGKKSGPEFNAVKKEAEQEILNALKQSVIELSQKTEVKINKKTKETSPTDRVKNARNILPILDSINTLEQWRDKILLDKWNKFGTRGEFNAYILRKKPSGVTKATRETHKIIHNKYGVPTIQEVQEGITEKAFSNAELGDVIKFITPDERAVIYTTDPKYKDLPKEGVQRKQKDNTYTLKYIGDQVDAHVSYPYIIAGKNDGFSPFYIDVTEIFPDLKDKVKKKSSFYKAGRRKIDAPSGEIGQSVVSKSSRVVYTSPEMTIRIGETNEVGAGGVDLEGRSFIEARDIEKSFPGFYKRVAAMFRRKDLPGGAQINYDLVLNAISLEHSSFSRAGIVLNRSLKILTEGETILDKLREYDRPKNLYKTRQEIINDISSYKEYNDKQKEILIGFINQIKSPDDRFFTFLTSPVKSIKPSPFGRKNSYTAFKNVLEAQAPSAFVHEVGHWGFFNLLTGKERTEYYEYFHNRFKDDKDNSLRADELNFGKPIYYTYEDGSPAPGRKSNNMDTPQEYFAVQFEQWYYNRVGYDNVLSKLFDVINNFIEVLISRFKKVGYNPELVSKFEKIVDLNATKDSAPRSKSAKAPSKNIGGEKYFHKQYLFSHIEEGDGVLTYDNYQKAEDSVMKALKNAGVSLDFNTFKYNPSTKVLTFQEGRGFDTMREPVVGHSIGVNLSTGKVVSGFKSDGSLRAPSESIWHNKWQWVDDTYTGFDVEAAKAWSEEWGSKFATGERRDIGKKENWDNKLREKGLPVEGTAVMSRSRLEPELVAPNVQIVRNPYTGVEHTIELPMSSGGTSIPQKNHVVTDFIKNSKKSPQKPEDIKRFASIGAGKKTFNGKASPSHEMMRDRMPNAEIYLLDPENISPEENLAELDKLFSRPADAAEAANVLNVIPDKAMRNNVIQSVYDVLDEGGWAYFKIFVGSKQNKTLGQAYKEGTLAYGNNKELNEELYKQNKEQGIADDSFYYSRQTGKDKMQVNQRAPFYQPEVEAVFGDKGFVDNDIIVVQKTSEVKSKSRGTLSVTERFETADIKELANYKSGRIYSTKWTGSAKAAESIQKKLIDAGFNVDVRVASTNSRYVEFYRESDQKEGVIRVSGHGRIGDITLETRTREAVGKTGKPYQYKDVFFTVNSDIDFANDFFEANVMTSKGFEATKEALDRFINAPKSKSSREWLDNVQLEARAKLQDRLARVLKIQEDIESYIGGSVPLNFDFKNAESRLPGTVRNLQNETEREAGEATKLFTSAGLNPQEFGDLLYALHAQERNNAIRIADTSIPDSLRSLRKMFDLTPTEVAKNSGISVDLYRSIEFNGDVTEQELDNILNSYGLTQDEFYRTYTRNNEGSGMSDLEARDILSKYGARNLDKPLASMLPAKLAKAVSIVHQITQKSRDLLVSSGLETRDAVDAYEFSFDNYIPLVGFVEEDENGPDTFYEGGRRLPVRGRVKRAMGRYSKADDPFTQVIIQNFNNIARAKKNEAMQKLYELVDDVKNPEVYKTIDPSKDVVYKKVIINGKIHRIPKTAREFSEKDGYVSVRFNGLERFIKFDDKRMVEALNGMNVQQVSPVFAALRTVNRVMTSTITVYDPEFVLRNFSRDIQIALVNVMAEQELEDGIVSGEKIVLDTFKGVMPSLKSIFKAQRGNEDNSPYATYYKEFLEDGGQIETFYGGNSKDVRDLINDFYSKESRTESTLSKLADTSEKWTFGLIKDVNSSVENAIRLSAYVAARKAGISREKAAELGKKVTVDFNKVGEYGQLANSFYLFFNASIQGSTRLFRTLKPKRINGELVITNPQKVAIGLVAFASLLALFNAAVSGEDDDDGKSWYSKIPDYEKERNMIFMNPFDKKGKEYAKIPLPYGYNIFYVLGNSISDVMLGENKLSNAITNVVLSTLSNFSPIGMPTSEKIENRILKMITPSVLQPITAISINEDFTGRPIYSENLPFDKTPLPNAELGKKDNPVTTNLAKMLNEVSGGSSVRSGSIDVNPDIIDYIIGYFGGGAAKTFGRAGGLIYNGVNGELKDVKPNDIPFARVFYGKAYDGIDYTKFYEKIVNVYQLNEEIKLGLRKGSEANRIRLTLAEAKAVDKRLRDLRKREKEGKIKEDKAEDLRNAIMKNFLRDYDKRKIDDI